ncbi:MAG: YebC/PmpR family DNA-binding transcriptional regulator [Candidatus Shapirobacteria bacterium]|nr:YebC/PmpR family DNA-binding transcriptional regulator [Candidatus Shapirobacteria bacterium]MDD3002284.1 YebC/PmpR family DNA-binding transcriptional regulator [Candidatus Shapirobacteria bacterium]MDD4382711.1 YebC/PmpR family DNA-binding transcriptional regulator [Candidatus Shapirobacteria bacterium]
MSGHSKWSNIKNRKGAQDKKRSEAFTKISKNILTAIRVGGGITNIEGNLGLKIAVEKAREVNMPKENIDRLIAKFEARKANLVAMTMEGYGPFGVPIVIELETDNKNRTLGEVKLVFRNYGGNLGESNSVMFQFKRVGEIELENNIPEDKELDLIDARAIDFDENIILVEANDLNGLVKKIEDMGLKVIRSELVLKSNNPTMLNSEEEVGKIMDMVEELEENDDVINVFAGFDYKKV